MARKTERKLWLDYLKNKHKLTEEEFEALSCFEQYSIHSSFCEKYKFLYVRD